MSEKRILDEIWPPHCGKSLTSCTISATTTLSSFGQGNVFVYSHYLPRNMIFSRTDIKGNVGFKWLVYALLVIQCLSWMLNEKRLCRMPLEGIFNDWLSCELRNSTHIHFYLAKCVILSSMYRRHIARALYFWSHTFECKIMSVLLLLVSTALLVQEDREVLCLHIYAAHSISCSSSYKGWVS